MEGEAVAAADATVPSPLCAVMVAVVMFGRDESHIYTHARIHKNTHEPPPSPCLPWPPRTGRPTAAAPGPTNPAAPAAGSRAARAAGSASAGGAGGRWGR